MSTGSGTGVPVSSAVTFPTSYTAATLQAYMHGQLGDSVTGILGWSIVGGQYAELVNDALLALDEDVIGDISGRIDIHKLRLNAMLATWRKVAAATTGYYDRNADGANLQRSQLHKQALANITLLEDQLSHFAQDLQEAGEIDSQTLDWSDADPYDRDFQTDDDD